MGDNNVAPGSAPHISPRARSGMQSGDPNPAAGDPFGRDGGAQAHTGPFGADDDDPTVVLGQGGPGGAHGAHAPAAGGGAGMPAEAADIERAREFQRMVARQPRTSDEIFLVAAAPLLTLIAQLRHMVDFADVAALRRRVVEEIDRFENRASAAGAQANEIMAARYILCAVLDETVLTKPWGNRSDWSVSSLLNQFHGETWGGEKVFQILERARGEPSKYLSLLRLIDMCLSLGFEGRYRVVDGGREQLESLRREVGRAISDQIGRPPMELSSDWKGVESARKLRTFVPLWLVFSVTAVLLIVGYLVAQYWLGLSIDPVINQIDRIAV